MISVRNVAHRGSAQGEETHWLAKKFESNCARTIIT